MGPETIIPAPFKKKDRLNGGFVVTLPADLKKLVRDETDRRQLRGMNDLIVEVLVERYTAKGLLQG